ncbi:MAG TPA: hypothetical protein VIX91_27705 [Candidatus Acidoferrum sp.]
MESLVQPDRLRTRIRLWAEEEIRRSNLPPKAESVLDAVLYCGEMGRGDAASVVNTAHRHASRIVLALLHRAVLISQNPRALPSIPAWRVRVVRLKNEYFLPFYLNQARPS